MLRLSVNVSRELLRTSKNVQKLAKCKFSRLTYSTTNISLGNNVLFNVHKHSRVPAIYVIRYQSTVDSTVKTTVANTQEAAPMQQIQNTIRNANTTEADKSFISEIPDAPIPPSEEVTSVVADVLTATGEPTFTSLGLGGYGPIGIAEYCLEMLHISCGLPWWAAISVMTIIVKLLTIPPTINMTKNNVKMYNIMPQMVEIQDKMSEARREGNKEEAAVYAYELQQLLKNNGISAVTFTNVLLRMFLHIPIFIGLREMAILPVESLKTGGLWWFSDLTVADPYYLLPIFTSVGLYIVTENALRSGGVPGTISPIMRYLMRGLPLVTFAFAINFPGAILCYWVLSNYITIAQNQILKMKKVQLFLNIPLRVEHKTKTNSILKKKNFKESFAESWTNIKISKKMANRLRADEMQFNEAGKGPVIRTFKYNPVTKQSEKSIAAMKK